MASETEYPDDNPKTVHGESKPGIHTIPPIAILVMGQAMAEGMRKYGHTNWRSKRVTSSVYYNAAQRHLMAWLDGQDCDPDTGIHHFGLAMACLGIVLDAKALGTLNDDRTVVPGPAPAFIAENTRKPPAFEESAFEANLKAGIQRGFDRIMAGKRLSTGEPS